MAFDELSQRATMGFNQGYAQGVREKLAREQNVARVYPDAPLMIAWNHDAPSGPIACAFRRFDDGSYRLESVVYFTAGDSDGGECD